MYAGMRHCNVVHGINVKPHMPVSCEVSAEAANASIAAVGGPCPLPKSFAYGPCARPEAQRQAGQAIFGPSLLDEAYSVWIANVEQCLAGLLPSTVAHVKQEYVRRGASFPTRGVPRYSRPAKSLASAREAAIVHRWILARARAMGAVDYAVAEATRLRLCMASGWSLVPALVASVRTAAHRWVSAEKVHHAASVVAAWRQQVSDLAASRALVA